MDRNTKDVTIVPITYKQLREGVWQKYDDKFGIASFIDDNIRNVFLTNPRNTDEDKTAILFAVNNGTIVGRHLLYGTLIARGRLSENSKSSEN